MEFLEETFLNLVEENSLNKAQIKITIFRKEDSTIDFIFDIFPFNSFLNKFEHFEVEVFNSEYVNTGILSTINCFKSEYVLAKIYAQENDLDDVILLNYQKRIARTTLGDLFFIQNNTLNFVSTSEGFSTQVLSELVKIHFVKKGYLLNENVFSPFETQKADTIFVVSEEKGIIPVNKIRNKSFSITILEEIFADF